MRRLFVLLTVGVVASALVATAAFAVTNNTVDYQVKLKKKGTPSKAKPAPLSYEGILTVGTDNNTQPNVAPTTKLFFAKQIAENAKYFPSCDPAKIDGQAAVPASCKKAKVGSGTAAASAGSPGGPIVPGLGEQLSVTAYNGLKGKQLLLVLNGSSPLTITNRVIVGRFGPGGGKFGYTITFTVPDDLQYQQGLQVALTHFDVKISPKTIKAKVKGKSKKVSYVALSACPKNHTLPLKTEVDFAQDGPIVGSPPHPQPGGQVKTVTGTTKC